MIYRLSLLVALCWCAFTGVEAQSLKSKGVSVDDIVPAGWLHTEVIGDLNKDGIDDLVVVATPDFKENTVTRDDGYVYNFNQPLLAVYFGSADGVFQMWKQYDEVIPPNADEFNSVSPTLEITERGVLRITIEFFSSGGSYYNVTPNYSYRYQNGDFYLIGMEQHSLRRNTGEMETISENYLTWKRQVVIDNAFEDAPPPKEKWSRLPKKPLEKLGDRMLE